MALQAVFKMFDDHGPGLKNVTAVAHRAVHGGDRFAAPVVIDDEVIATMQELVPLAPLHNPAVIEGIRAAQSLLGNVPHVAIFDTAFFTQLPEEAYTYAIDRDLAKRNAIRKYGFHGTSHQYVSQQVPAVVGTDLGELNQIVCHLGNGASISAIKGGKPIDTSMGLTPLAGLVMGTRSGDIDRACSPTPHAPRAGAPSASTPSSTRTRECSDSPVTPTCVTSRPPSRRATRPPSPA